MAKGNRKQSTKTKAKAPRKRGPRAAKRAPALMARIPRDVRRIGPAGTPAGLDFLKTAIAPWDFPGIQCDGVPDAFSGKSLVHVHRQIVDIALTASDRYTIIILAPIPGVAYLQASPTTGLTAIEYIAKPFPDFDAFYGSGTSTSANMLANVTKFRVIGSSMRAQSTSSVLNNAGRLTAVRLDDVVETDYAIAGAPAVSGLYDVDLNEFSSYPGAVTAHVNDGLTLWSVNGEAVWTFNPIWSGENIIRASENTQKNLVTMDNPAKWIPGWGNGTCTALIVSGSNTSTSLTLELTQTVEYLPKPGSLLAGQCRPSPSEDVLALQSYKEATRQLPVAVPRSKNDGFWDGFLSLIAGVAPVIGAAFGPQGQAIGAGIGTISQGLRTLTMGSSSRRSR